MKAIEPFFQVILFIMLYKVILTFKSVDQILVCDHSNESYQAVLSCRTHGCPMLWKVVLTFKFLACYHHQSYHCEVISYAALRFSAFLPIHLFWYHLSQGFGERDSSKWIIDTKEYEISVNTKVLTCFLLSVDYLKRFYPKHTSGFSFRYKRRFVVIQ